MKLSIRAADAFVVGTYLALSAIPLAPLLWIGKLADPWQLVFIEAGCWLCLWAIFKRPAYFHWFLLPCFFALPAQLYLQRFYGQDISAHHLGILIETSPKEALEFLGGKVLLLVATVAAMLAWWMACGVAALRARGLDCGNTLRAAVLVLLALWSGGWLYSRTAGFELPDGMSSSSRDRAEASDAANDSRFLESADSSAGAAGASVVLAQVATSAGLPHSAFLANFTKKLFSPFSIDTFAQTWPFGLFVKFQAFWHEHAYLQQLSERSGQFHFGAHQRTSTNTPQLVVMVIGESSRFDRWSLNGYSRDTNPLLKQEPNLVSLTDVVSAVSATRLSVPILVSRKPATQSLKAGFSERSFLTAFKEAGFKTFWLSNQMSFGQFDTPVSVFASEADVTQFLNLGGYTESSSYDEILLAPLKNAIADPAPKKLIVLHTLGNHWNYSHRYPKPFDRWRPSLFGVTDPDYTDRSIKAEMNNSYDNSVLYTDWFLSQVIARLKASDAISSLMYVSDHGQTLYDGSCDLAFHGHNTAFEFHVPALVWMSDRYRQAFPEKFALLKLHQKARLSTENVFHSLVDMGNIRYDTERLEWSFLSGKLKSHKRYVDSYGWTDYDHAELRGDCKEVIDRGKPLAQEK